MIILKAGDSINGALEKCAEGETLFLTAGAYEEKVVVSRHGVTIEGESAENVIISRGDYAKKIHTDKQEHNTFRTYTVLVSANDVTLKNLTVKNTAGDPKANGQAVALSINGGNVKVEGCILDSLQDTLFCGPLPDDLILRYQDFLSDAERFYEGGAKQYFTDCVISGSVDFIFGCGEAYFSRCKIISVYDGRDTGFVAAPAHSLKQTGGFCFYDCDFLSGGALDGSVYLARPWRDFGKAVFMNCRLGPHINSALFDKWNDTGRDKTARFYEYGLSGEGAKEGNRAYFGRVLSEAQASEIESRLKYKIKNL